MSVSKASAAPLEVVLQGVTYKFTPLRDVEFGEYENWIQDRFIQVTLRNLDKAPKEYRESLLQKAYETAAKITITSEASLEFMESPEGAVKLVMLSLRQYHPDIKESLVAEMIMQPLLVEKMMSAVDRLNSITPIVKKVVGRKKRPTRKTSKRRKKKK